MEDTTNKKFTEQTKLKISEKAKARDNSLNQKMATSAAMKSPKSGRFVTNVSAKQWVLRSPDGNIFYARNLKHWLRENAEKYFGEEANDKNVDRFAHGFFTIKRNLKRGKGTITYKDWTIILEKEESNDN